MNRYSLRLVLMMVFGVLLMGARLPIEEGCSSARGIYWVDADGGNAVLSFNALRTATHTTDDTGGLGPLREGSLWRADDHSRLVLSSDKLDSMIAEFPDDTILALRNNPNKRWSDFPEVRRVTNYMWEMPWAGGAHGDDQAIPESGFCGVFGAYCPQTVRNVDIGLCSVRLPWVADPTTPTNDVTERLGVGTEAGTGVAEMIAHAIQGTADGTWFGGGPRDEFVKATLTEIPIAQGWARLAAGGRDELCIRTNFSAEPDPKFFAINGCGEKRLQMEVCGTFGVEDGAVTFDVTSADAHMKKYGRIRAFCNGAVDVIEDKAVEALQGAGNAIATLVNLKLRLGGLEGIERVEVLPTGMELILAEEAGDPSIDLLGPDAIDQVCGTTETGEGGTRSSEREVEWSSLVSYEQGMILDWPEGMERPY